MQLTVLLIQQNEFNSKSLSITQAGLANASPLIQTLIVRYVLKVLIDDANLCGWLVPHPRLSHNLNERLQPPF